MQPVEPSTMVRGPAALTISFITRADSHPWQVRCPEVKYSSRVTRLMPRKGSRIWVALVNAVVSAIGGLLFAHAQPVGAGVGLTGVRGTVTHVGGLVDVLQGDLAPAQPADEAQQRRSPLGIVEGGADLVGHHPRGEGRAE